MTNVAPVIKKKAPKIIKLEKGKKHYWCSCGHSENQPLCGGFHVGNKLKPLKYLAEQTENFVLCQCKSSTNASFCDSTHAQLDGLNKRSSAKTKVRCTFRAAYKRGTSYRTNSLTSPRPILKDCSPQ